VLLRRVWTRANDYARVYVMRSGLKLLRVFSRRVERCKRRWLREMWVRMVERREVDKV
jgi:hypothetical protein